MGARGLGPRGSASASADGERMEHLSRSSRGSVGAAGSACAQRAGRSTRRVAAALFSLAVAGGCGDGLNKPDLVEATSGFDPKKHGFSFENFAGFVSTAIFDQWSMRRMYGDNVCMQVQGEQCELRPEAQAFADQVNAATSGGLCEGFAALPALNFAKKIKLSELGVKSDPFLVSREELTLIDREIAYWFGTQLLPKVKAGTTRVSGREAVDVLGRAFRDTPGKTFRVGMVRLNAAGQAEGGHALLPYATKNTGGDRWQILVYDSNHPAESRAIDVDAAADTWKYVAATNPAEPAGMYSGKGKKNRLYLIDNDLRMGQQPCPFCPGGSGGSQTVMSFGAIMASVKTSSGSTAGNTDEGFKDEDKGATATPIYGLQGSDRLLGDQLPLMIDVPLGEKIEIVAKSNKASVAKLVGAKDPGAQVVSVVALQGGGAFSSLRSKGGVATEFRLKSDGPGQVVVSSDSKDPIKVGAGLVTAEGKAVSVSIEVTGTSGNQAVGLVLSTKDGATQVDLPNGGTATVAIEVATAQGKSTFTGSVTAEAGDKVAIDVPAMKPGEPPPAGKDKDGDGKPDDPKPLKPCSEDPACAAKKGDNDIVPDDVDNCPDVDNPDQADLDKDKKGDLCDDDADGDGVPKPVDCNDLDAKLNGPCSASATPNCTSDSECTAPAGTCFAAKCDAGKCAVGPAADGKVCDDGNGCTEGDACLAGKCTPGKVKACDDGNPCTAEACKDHACAISPADVSCNDGNACTVGDVCAKGACTPGSSVACADGNPCTADACDPAKGCTFTDNNDPCSDNNPCTTDDACTGGVCKPKNQAQCDDNNPCTTEACDGSGKCSFANNTAACTDGDVCTGGDVCANGACQSGLKAACFDGNPCTDDGCDKATGCVYLANAATCSDANACTSGEACAGSACAGGKTIECNDGKPCTLDGCDIAGGCVFSNTTDACSDGDSCTSGDTCKDGACVAGSAVGCDDGNPCTADGCDKQKGCNSSPNTATCTDNSACTVGDACAAGACLPGAATNCDDGNPCTTDSCDTAKGCQSAPNTMPCNDNDACTANDACAAGACLAGKALTCNDGNLCTDDACDPAKGCTAAATTAACDDGNVCSVGDACKAGLCLPGAPNACDDGNPCTTDACGVAKGCQSAPNTMPCTDNDACTANDLCAAGACQPGKLVTCSDGNPCTDDACNPADGCTASPNAAACDDGSACSVGDSCNAGLCLPGAPTACDDGNGCTADSCNAKAGCVHTANGVACSDGDACTVGDTCAGGACKAGAGLPCDDGNPCTDGACDKGTGCAYVANKAPCSDNNACTVGDTCEDTACLPGPATACDDGNGCTSDSCAPKTGCQVTHNSFACTDGSVCTVGDQCTGGVCAPGAAQVCNDGNVCTDDSCDAAKGCVYLANSASCTDNNVCTIGDQCQGTACLPGAATGCDDGNFCTDDGCHVTKGCAQTANTKTCSDGNGCTVNDLCTNAVCVAGAAATCDDGNVCTADSCIPATGKCEFTAVKTTTSCGAGGAGVCIGTTCAVQTGCGDTSGLQKGSPWPMAGGCPTRVGRSPLVAAAKTTPKLKWKFQTLDIRASPTISKDGVIYVGTTSNVNLQFYAIKPDGTKLWSFPTGTWQTAPIGADGTVYFGGGQTKFYGLKPDGTVKWVNTTGFSFQYTSPVIAPDGTIYTGTANKTLLALSSQDGTLKWVYNSSDHIWANPALGTDGTIYTATTDAKFVAITPSGAQKFSVPVDSGVAGTMLVGPDGTIYFVSMGGTMYAYEPTGVQKFKLKLSANTFSGPALATDGRLVTPTTDGMLHYVKTSDFTKTSALVSPARIDSIPIIDAAGTIFVGSCDFSLHAVASSTGQVMWSTPTAQIIYSSAAIGADGTVYVGSSDGFLYAYGSN